MPVGETVLITGAGSGIGRELARLFAGDGSTVVAASLVPEELNSLSEELSSKGVTVHTIEIDLSGEDAARRLVAICDERGLVIDTLVNNAGFACFNEVVDENLDRLTAMISLNVTALTLLSAIYGARMKTRGRGAILNVGSTAGMVPARRMAAYCASKAYVNAFTYALSAELAPFGVKVTCLTPGATATKFGEASGITRFKGKSMLKSMFRDGKAGSAASVARDAFTGLRTGRRQVLTGKGARLAGLISRFVPTSRIPDLFKHT